MNGIKFFIWTGVIAYLSWPLYFLIDQSHEYKRGDIIEAMSLATAMVLVYAVSLFFHYKKT